MASCKAFAAGGAYASVTVAPSATACASVKVSVLPLIWALWTAMEVDPTVNDATTGTLVESSAWSNTTCS